MKTCKHLTYTRKIQWRIRALWLLLTGMLVYMVLIAELGGGDSRMMTPLADKFSRIVFFGGLGYVIGRICKNKQLLRSRQLLQQQMKTELDERNQYLHDRQKRRHCGGYPARHPALCHAHRVDVRHGGFLHGIFRAGRRHPSESCGVLVLQPSGR